MYRLNLPLLERLFQEGPGRGKESYCKVERNATSSALLGGLKKAGQITFFFFCLTKYIEPKVCLSAFYSCITWS